MSDESTRANRTLHFVQSDERLLIGTQFSNV